MSHSLRHEKYKLPQEAVVERKRNIKEKAVLDAERKNLTVLSFEQFSTQQQTCLFHSDRQPSLNTPLEEEKLVIQTFQLYGKNSRRIRSLRTSRPALNVERMTVHNQKTNIITPIVY